MTDKTTLTAEEAASAFVMLWTKTKGRTTEGLRDGIASLLTEAYRRGHDAGSKVAPLWGGSPLHIVIEPKSKAMSRAPIRAELRGIDCIYVMSEHGNICRVSFGWDEMPIFEMVRLGAGHWPTEILAECSRT